MPTHPDINLLTTNCYKPAAWIVKLCKLLSAKGGSETLNLYVSFSTNFPPPDSSDFVNTEFMAAFEEVMEIALMEEKEVKTTITIPMWF